MSYSRSSFRRGVSIKGLGIWARGYIGDFYIVGIIRGMLGVKTIAHMN